MGLIDLILSPSGSLPFYHRLVPASKDCKSKTELSEKLVDYCYSFYGLPHHRKLIVGGGFTTPLAPPAKENHRCQIS